jgi:hypothetical protein
MGLRARVTRQPKNKWPQLVRKSKQQDILDDEFRRHRALRILAVVCILAVLGWIFVALFAPGLKYQVAQTPTTAIDSPEFLRELEALTDSRLSRNNRIESLPNGENFYEAEIAAMKQARHEASAIRARLRMAGRAVAASTIDASPGTRIRRWGDGASPRSQITNEQHAILSRRHLQHPQMPRA